MVDVERRLPLRLLGFANDSPVRTGMRKSDPSAGRDTIRPVNRNVVDQRLGRETD